MKDLMAGLFVVLVILLLLGLAEWRARGGGTKGEGALAGAAMVCVGIVAVIGGVLGLLYLVRFVLGIS